MGQNIPKNPIIAGLLMAVSPTAAYSKPDPKADRKLSTPSEI